MGTYDELKARYGEWMRREDIVEATGIGSAGSPGHYAVRGAARCSRTVNGRYRVFYRTEDVARNIEQHDSQLKNAKKREQNKHLCRTCRWRSRYSTDAGADLHCSYCMHPPHHTKHWHKAHGMENALDIAHCPFYERGQHEHIPMISAYIHPLERKYFDT